MTVSLESLALVEVGDGGLLLNLDSGVLFQLNGSASFVWKGILEGQSQAVIAEALARRYGLAPRDAERDVAIARAMDHSQPAAYPPLASEFNYEWIEEGYLFSFRGEPVLRVDDRGTLLTRPNPSDPPDGRIEFFLQAIVPKVAALRGGLVFHASAFVARDDKVTAISGASGAGKTTTVHAVAAAGAKMISEDKVVLSVRGDRTFVMLEGERRLEGWVARAAVDIASKGRADCEGIDEALSDGPAMVLGSILFIDAGRRAGQQVALQQVDPAAAAAHVFHNTFYGSDRDDDWRNILTDCARVGGCVPAYLATMPADLAALRLAAKSLAVGALRSE